MAKTWRISGRIAGSLMIMTSLVEPCLAAMPQDLSDCAATNRSSSADACTRVLNSGRLQKGQSYIGYYNRGWAHYYRGQLDKALEDFDLSSRHNAQFADAVLGRALVRLEMGERDRVQADLDRYLQLKGDIEAARLNRAIVFRRRGDLDRAMFELPAKPKSQNISLLKALILSDRGEHGSARAEVDAILARGPATAAAFYTRAAVDYREGRLNDAEANAKKASALKAGFAEAIYLLGQVAEVRGDPANAKAFYRQVEALAPTSAESFWARQDARKRLRSLSSGTRSAEAVLLDTSGPDCRRFIPSAGITIATECR